MARLDRPAADYVVIILAAGMAVALNLLVAALLYAAVARYVAGAELALSENGVQLLTGWGGGIVSVLAGYIGYAVGRRRPEPGDPPPPEPINL